MNGKRTIALAGAVSLGLIAIFVIFLLRPKLNQIGETREQILAAEEQEQQLQLSLQRLRAVRDEAPQTRARLARVSDLLPSTPELPTFIRLVQDAATDEGIELISIAPSAPNEVDEQIDAISVSLLIEGSFHRTEAFLASLENLQRLVEVTSIAMSPVEDPVGGSFTLSTTLSMRMYVYNEAAPA